MNKACCSKYPHNCKRIIAVPCHRKVKSVSPSKVGKDLGKRYAENFVKGLNEGDVKRAGANVIVVLKLGDYTIFKLNLKEDTTALTLDIKDILKEHQWRGMLVNNENLETVVL